MSDILEQYLDKLENEKLDEVATPFIVLGAISAAFSISNMAFRTYQDYFSKAARACRELPAREKSLCMVKAKLDGKQQQLNVIKRRSNECSKTRNPPKCRSKLAEKIRKLTDEVQFAKNRLRDLRKMEYA